MRMRMEVIEEEAFYNCLDSVSPSANFDGSPLQTSRTTDAWYAQPSGKIGICRSDLCTQRSLDLPSLNTHVPGTATADHPCAIGSP
jgi:hypothetical protein